MTRAYRKPFAAAAIAGLLAGAPLSPFAAAQELPAPTGDAERGRTLFTTTYKCYACHGYDAQTGERRLVPMRYTEDAFTMFVQRSPLPQMPAYPDMSAEALADVYAYIRSIELDAPSLEETPLLQDILARKMEPFSN